LYPPQFSGQELT